MQKKYAKSNEVNRMERTKIIREYRQPGGDADGDNIVGWGEDGYKIFYCVILLH